MDRPDLQASLAKLEQALRRGPEVDRVSNRLIQEAKDNNWALAIEAAITGIDPRSK